MRNISNSSRQNNNSEISSNNDDLGAYFKDSYKPHSLIKQANFVDLSLIFNFYNIKFDNDKTTCPFLTHKGGKENTPSFKYYSETNSFWCHGCNNGSFATDFVANMDNISKEDAANKILQNFSIEGYQDISQDSHDKLSLYLDFSKLVLEFRTKFSDEKSFKYIEDICFAFDKLNIKYSLDNIALKYLINKLKEEIQNYV